MGAESGQRLRLHSRDDADRVVWPPDGAGPGSRAFLQALLRDGVRRYVENVTAEVHLLEVDGELVPLAVHSGAYDDAYVASPYTHYLSYSREVVALAGNPALRRLFSGAISVGERLFRATAINDVVFVGGCFFASCLHPPLSARQLRAIAAFLSERFPGHGVVFAGVDGALSAQLRAAGFALVYHRPTYRLDPAQPGFRPTKNLRADLARLRKTGYELVGADALGESDAPRLKELYDGVYLGKHSRWNPRYTEEFFRLALRGGAAELKALRRDGRVDGFLGLRRGGGTLTGALLGYDVDAPSGAGLYRMLFALLVSTARDEGRALDCGSGVGRFKRLRGGRKTLEYLAVHHAHLPARRRLPWLVLQALNPVVVPLLRRLEF